MSTNDERRTTDSSGGRAIKQSKSEKRSPNGAYSFEKRELLKPDKMTTAPAAPFALIPWESGCPLVDVSFCIVSLASIIDPADLRPTALLLPPSLFSQTAIPLALGKNLIGRNTSEAVNISLSNYGLPSALNVFISYVVNTKTMIFFELWKWRCDYEDRMHALNHISFGALLCP